MTNYTGAIDLRGDTDTFSQFLTAGRTYYIELEADGSDLDPLLRLFLSGDRLQTNDDGGDGLNSRIVFRPTVSGTYEFETAAFADSSTGDYVLRVNKDDFRGTPDGVGAAGAVGGDRLPDTGAITFVEDRDVFSTVLVAGLRYSVTQTGVDGGGGTLSDPSLRLLDATGLVLARNDDSNGTRDAALDYRATLNETVYVEAGTAGGTGTYTVDVGIGRATVRDDFVTGTRYADAINGIGGDDDIRGEAGDDYLFGGSGNDRLRGGSGEDTLVGWIGADELIGGRGDYVYLFTAASDSTFAGPDLILWGDGAPPMEGVGVRGGDRIDVSTLDANLNVRGNQAFRFGETDIQGLSLYNSGRDTVVRANTDEDAAFEFFLRIQDGSVTAQDYARADFLL